jgi:hypothetical protein
MRTIVVLIAMGLASAQQLPRFEDYPVGQIFKGTPAAPILDTHEKRLYRTRIREGVAKGLGVSRDGKEDQPGANFAGHYVIVEWQCGSPCGMMAMVDAVSGKVYDLPLSKDLRLPDIMPGDPGQCPQWEYAMLEFRQNSRLMTVAANPDPLKEKGNYKHYFLWENERWRLVRRVPACGL